MSKPQAQGMNPRSTNRPRRALRIGGIITTAVLAVTLSACSSTADSGTDESGSDGPVTLEFWTYSLKGGDPAAEAIIDTYEEANPGVTIKLSEVGGTAETSSKLLAADRANETPDVVQVEYRALPSLVVAGVVKDITADVADSMGAVDENVWELTTLNDQVYGVPQDIGPMMFTYRADLFEQYGAKVPTTWA